MWVTMAAGAASRVSGRGERLAETRLTQQPYPALAGRRYRSPIDSRADGAYCPADTAPVSLGR